MSNIEWTDVPNYPGYSVNRAGEIRGPRGLMKPMRAHLGHLYILCKRQRPRKLYVHRAVLLAFIGPCPAGMEACHGDGNPANNRLENLRWDTRLANAADKQLHGTQPRGAKSGTAKLSIDQVREIRSLHGRRTLRSLARQFNVSHTAIRRAATGVTWESDNG